MICPYRSRCAAAQARAIPAAGTGGLDEPTLHDIDRLVAARQRALEAGEEAARACAEAEAEIAAVLAEAGARKVKRNGYAVTMMKTGGGDGRRHRNPLRLKTAERVRAPGPKPPRKGCSPII